MIASRPNTTCNLHIGGLDRNVVEDQLAVEVAGTISTVLARNIIATTMTANGQQVGRSASILFGSETGNACDYAEEFGRISERLNFYTTVAKLNDVKPVSHSTLSCGRPN